MDEMATGIRQRREALIRVVRTRYAIPGPSTAARLTLIALALFLQNLLELPRELFTRVLGATATGVMVFVILAASLVLLMAGVGAAPPPWHWPYRRATQILALCLTLLVVPLGIAQTAKIVGASFSAPEYANDGTTLDHYAAQQLLEGHNPYASSDIVSAVRFLHQDPAHTTPLRQGEFGSRAPTQYPSPDELRTVFAQQPVGRPDSVHAFESRVSYPALSFLVLVPFVWAGLPSVVLFFALCLLALSILMVRLVPTDCRIWVGLLILADTPLLNATLVGDLDVFYVLLLFVAWGWWQRGGVSTIALGLALAAKQLAWFFVPFYVLFIWRRRGPREALTRLAGAGVVFAGINTPFVINNPGAWLRGVLAPQIDPMFPLGNGLIRLSLAGVLPLAPSSVYLALEVLAILACIFLYWREGRTSRGTGFALAVLPLWFAWRSLTTYFYFVTLPALALALADGRAANVSDVPDPGDSHVLDRSRMEPAGAPSEVVHHE
ncbi:MAG TPA: glycosyltransferase 87 family protein [Ktedonobacterales bacterium]|nr:glycosyltransferase 87 family protein [Ktedonobacterales bacterium]